MRGFPTQRLQEIEASAVRAVRVGERAAGHAVQPGQNRSAGYLVQPAPCGGEDLGNDVRDLVGVDPPSHVGADVGVVLPIQLSEPLLVGCCVHIPSTAVCVRRDPVLTGTARYFPRRSGVSVSDGNSESRRVPAATGVHSCGTRSTGKTAVLTSQPIWSPQVTGLATKQIMCDRTTGRSTDYQIASTHSGWSMNGLRLCW